MPFRDVIDNEQLALLRRIFGDYCAEYSLSESKRLVAAAKLMALFRSGVEDPRALAAALRERAPMASRADVA